MAAEAAGHTGVSGAAMAYVPIFKGKLGEFTALGHMAPEVQEMVRPVMEVVPDREVRDILETFRQNAWEHLPAGLDLAVDCGALWRHGPVGGVWRGPPLSWLSESFGAWLLTLLPVFRPDDPKCALAEVRDVQRAHRGGAVMRLCLDWMPGDPVLADRLTAETLSGLSLAAEEIDLLLDAGHVSCDTAVAEAVPRMLYALRWASRTSWRSVTVASGAFPPTLRGLPRERLHPFRRWDAALWRKVAHAFRGQAPDFGDYGITHTAMSVAPGRRAAPNLRYTVGEDWAVSISHNHHPGNDGFFALCEDLLHSGLWPVHGESVSWGDEQLAVCARRLRRKAGRPADWRAWATSHHLAVVTDSLRTLGVP
ncbi:beta family protein [Streptomyces aculeolatus]|uniref:beta family protein n=1 Tax=Streptomyces aculeolatus TaxID=270689 RepID=UPI001CECDA36|nr:beta family protein [Streptomyces aculeolatus]